MHLVSEEGMVKVNLPGVDCASARRIELVYTAGHPI